MTAVPEDPSSLTRHNQELWERQPQTFVDRRVETILELLPRLGPEAALLDIGCLEGTLTRLYAERIGTQRVHGIDMASVEEARSKGVDAIAFDLNSGSAPLSERIRRGYV